ncbi:hypothetical protein NDU88_004945 [Pleurodeles waltl]|uniref:Uncharacterized protein n=1 Tax=Pleurodeles waltl TaxID=8319 RepID=A0AAV7LJT8_PLEWA|nr:hypothetical protein NDU88_004945 [Pleurodeles waltl]
MPPLGCTERPVADHSRSLVDNISADTAFVLEHTGAPGIVLPSLAWNTKYGIGPTLSLRAIESGGSHMAAWATAAHPSAKAVEERGHLGMCLGCCDTPIAKAVEEGGHLGMHKPGEAPGCRTGVRPRAPEGPRHRNILPEWLAGTWLSLHVGRVEHPGDTSPVARPEAETRRGTGRRRDRRRAYCCAGRSQEQGRTMLGSEEPAGDDRRLLRQRRQDPAGPGRCRVWGGQTEWMRPGKRCVTCAAPLPWICESAFAGRWEDTH